MAKNDNIRGVEFILIGAHGDGVVGTSLTKFTDIAVNTLTFQGGEATTEPIKTENNDSYLTIVTGGTETVAEFDLYGVTGEQAVMLLGGEYDASTKTYKAPKQIPNKYLSVVIQSEEVAGTKKRIEMPYAVCTAKYSGNMTKGELLKIHVKAIANTPVSSSGVEGSPYEIKTIDA
ncbi:MAG: hypothetical protein KGV59_05425 [Tenacibaculum sp.]|nr:hypothetical protein [Tenacibaculum sp.]